MATTLGYGFDGARLDIISLLLLATGLAMFLFGSLFVTYSQTNAFINLFAAVLVIGGFVLGGAINRFQFDNTFSPDESTKIIVWTAVSAGAIIGVNFAVTATRTLGLSGTPTSALLASAPLNQKTFAVMIAVGEELMFRYFWTSFLIWLAGEGVGIFFSATIFTVYHFAVYGTAPFLLLIVFLSGLVLAFAYYNSGRLSPTMLSHVTVNFLAASGG